MNKANYDLLYGNPKNWAIKSLYLKYSEREKYDEDFADIIDQEILARGGIERVKELYDEALAQEEAESLQKGKNKKRRVRVLTIILSILAIPLIGYGIYAYFTSEKFDLQKAKKQDSVESFELFLKEYPDGKYTHEAMFLLEELEFMQAKESGDLESFWFFLEKYPESVFVEEARALLEEMEYAHAKETKDIDLCIAYINHYPSGKYAKLDGEFYQMITAIATEDKDLIEEYLKKYPDSEFAEYAKFVADSQYDLLRADFKNATPVESREAVSTYENDFVEIAEAMNAMQGPNILLKAKYLRDRGDFMGIWPLLAQLQSGIDNRLVRHTMVNYLYVSIQNYRMPTSLKQLESMENKMKAYEDRKDQFELSMGSISDSADYGNVMTGISIVTIPARFRGAGLDIVRTEFDAGRIDFSGLIEMMEPMGQLAGTMNAIVIESAKDLLNKRYAKLGIKGKYATLKWLDYLIESVEFGVTLRVGEIDKILAELVKEEPNLLLRGYASEIIGKIENASSI